LPGLPILLIDHPLANRTLPEIDVIAQERLSDVVQFLTGLPKT
jgi:hypothetical protein